MSNIVSVSPLKRALAVATVGMFMLTGLSLTAAPANASEMETVKYTYTVKVPVVKTVLEWQPVKKTLSNGRTSVTYVKVAKNVTQYRLETRTGERQVAKKTEVKATPAKYIVQIDSNGDFAGSDLKNIPLMASTGAAKKMNIADQISGTDGTVVHVRVAAEGSAGKSTPSAATKLAFGTVRTDVVPTTRYGQETYLAQAGYWYSYTDYGKPQYRTVNVAARYENQSYTYYESVAYTAYKMTSVKTFSHNKSVFSHNETYYVTVSYSYNCGTAKKPKTCTGTDREPRQRAVYESIPVYYWVDKQVAYTAYKDVARTGTRSVKVADAYSYSELTGYGSSDAYSQPVYQTRGISWVENVNVPVKGWSKTN